MAIKDFSQKIHATNGNNCLFYMFINMFSSIYSCFRRYNVDATFLENKQKITSNFKIKNPQKNKIKNGGS